MKIKCEKCGNEIDIRCVLFNDKNISEEEKQKLYKQIVKLICKHKKTK